MIKETTYQAEWLNNTAKKLGRKVDPKMLEKVVYAFTLLEQLRLHNIDLIFKGGTCLLLMTSPPRRFSIDIDIITEATAEEIEAALEHIVAYSAFTRWKSNNERKHVNNAPVGHYKLYYESQINQHYGEEPILLDILYTANPYPATQKVEIKHQWLQTEGKMLLVEVPDLEALLGDKLTAFAPNTTGILYGKGRPTEIIKQLYDIAFLFDLSEDISIIKASYEKVVKEEIGFRKLEIEGNEVLDDTFQTCCLLAQRDANSAQFKHLQLGIRNITNFIIENFRIEEAITAGAKTAYLCQLLKKDKPKRTKSYSTPAYIKDWNIKDPDYNKLNKLKKSNPEAFYYWYLAIQTMNA